MPFGSSFLQPPPGACEHRHQERALGRAREALPEHRLHPGMRNVPVYALPVLRGIGWGEGNANCFL